MKCDACPYALSCIAGRLDYHDGVSANFVLLCPECNRLMLGLNQPSVAGEPVFKTIDIFDCEQRHFSDEVRASWSRAIISGLAQRHQAYAIPDVGPGLRGKLSMGLCFKCADLMPVNAGGVHTTVRYLDDQTEDHVVPRSPTNE